MNLECMLSWCECLCKVDVSTCSKDSYMVTKCRALKITQKMFLSSMMTIHCTHTHTHTQTHNTSCTYFLNLISLTYRTSRVLHWQQLLMWRLQTSALWDWACSSVMRLETAGSSSVKPYDSYFMNSHHFKLVTLPSQLHPATLCIRGSRHLK